MSSIVLQDGGSRAAISVQFGFNVFEFQAQVGDRCVDVIDSLPALLQGTRRPTHSGAPILFPFPNRIRNGRFHWNGVAYIAPVLPDRPDAIHGYALDSRWHIVEQGPRHAVGRWQLSVDAPDRTANWPADCILEVRYELQGPTLRSQFRIANPDSRPLPWGLGTHTYFKLPLGPEGRREDCQLLAPAHKLWVLENSLPTGEQVAVTAEKDLRTWRSIGTELRDDVYTDVRPTNGVVECIMRDPAAGLEIVQRSDAAFRELVVFTPPNRRVVCMEPYTCVTDAINCQQQGMDAGLHILPPGDEVTTWIDISVRPSATKGINCPRQFPAG
ncbi:MAG: aldose 1-epimerase [Planctomycetaceae bacterium]|nr:aldose 1-epimerase [Planctomycetaceae bacterium]